MGHVFNLSLAMAKALNLSLAPDRTFEYEHRVINVTVSYGRHHEEIHKEREASVLFLQVECFKKEEGTIMVSSWVLRLALGIKIRLKFKFL